MVSNWTLDLARNRETKLLEAMSRGYSTGGGISLRRTTTRSGYGGSRIRAPWTKTRHGYGGTRRKYYRGYDRSGGFYGRFGGGYAAGGELKFHDVTLDDAVVSATGTVTPTVNIIAQGNTESTRNGRKCTIKAFQWRYHISLPEVNDDTDPGPPDQVRVILFEDSQANGATATVTDILESAVLHSFRNLSNTQRFKFHCDKTYSLNYSGMGSPVAGGVAQAQVVREYTFYKKVNIPLEFNSNAGVIGEIRSNNLGVLLISHAGVAGFFSSIRLRFSDASAPCY